jgi:hypothetical protein
MQLHAGVSRFARGILGDDVAATGAARHELVQLGVESPARMLRLWVPGVDDPITTCRGPDRARS